MAISVSTLQFLLSVIDIVSVDFTKLLNIKSLNDDRWKTPYFASGCIFCTNHGSKRKCVSKQSSAYTEIDIEEKYVGYHRPKVDWKESMFPSTIGCDTEGSLVKGKFTFFKKS